MAKDDTQTFGTKNQRSNDIADVRLRLRTAVEPAHIKAKRAKTWKDYLFYGFVGLLFMSAAGNIGRIFEDPKVRDARLAGEVQAAAEAKRTEAAQKAIEDANQRKLDAAAKEAARIASLPKLKVESWQCTNEYGFAKVTGEVTNRSSEPIESLMVIGIFRTSNDEFVKSAEAMVDYQPLMPGQTSPFPAMTTDNPIMRNCNVAFKTMFGGLVSSGR
ncbi:FxLYD domain-containing protein [Mesorhizobium sp. M1169]|uniref:FxLYD domain-containing protein n=1 Tax=Mesorhizobium sp. M1169 TaxID=2957066 RepID=UPI00333D687C